MSADRAERVRAERLRQAFDASFALPPPEVDRERVPLLLLRAGGQRLAARLRDLQGLVRLGAVTPVPSRRPELLGLTGLRGELVAVFDLARLLGLPDHGGAARWLLLAGGAERAALAFEEFEGYAQVAPGDLHPAQAPGPLPELARLPDRSVPVLGLPHLLQALAGR